METFSIRNRKRCESPSGFNHKLDSWSLSDWMTALIGEIGEAANNIKKLNRIRDGIIQPNGETKEILMENLEKELADGQIYLDLLIQAAGFDPEIIRNKKFNETSFKIGYKE